MRRVLFVLVTAAAFCSAAAAVAFFRPGPERWDAEAELKPVREGGEYRFADIAGNAYSGRFRREFRYGPPARAVLKYSRNSDTFRGLLVVRGYKPNFAYQVKLVGIPEDPAAAERIGFAGRWLLPGGGTNFSDEDYLALEDKSRAEGYLFFDWFVTDGEGNARVELRLDRSLHVLINDTLEGSQAPPGAAVSIFEVKDFPAFAYDPPLPSPRAVRIWEMSEHMWSGRRPPPGRTRLPAGEYLCLLRLTEESFHGAGGGGFWATASEAPVRFRITAARREGGRR